jgi:hypothetical protein
VSGLPSPTIEQVEALADAMWQLLDDMCDGGQSVCLAAKAQARIAYEPFRDKSEPEHDDWMSLAEAEAVEGRPDR